MKSALILILIFLLDLPFLIAQPKENDQGNAEINQISTSARHWFKDTYLKSKFPDAHAFKILELKATPVSKLEQIKLEIDKSTQGISAYDTLAAGSNYSHYLHIYNQYQLDHEKMVAESGTESSAAIEKKSLMDQYMVKIKETKLNLKKAVKAGLFWNHALKDLPKDQANITAYYNIYIQCRWKSASGKKMSGNYYFNFDKNGLIGEVSENTF